MALRRVYTSVKSKEVFGQSDMSVWETMGGNAYFKFIISHIYSSIIIKTTLSVLKKYLVPIFLPVSIGFYAVAPEF